MFSSDNEDINLGSDFFSSQSDDVFSVDENLFSDELVAFNKSAVQVAKVVLREENGVDNSSQRENNDDLGKNNIGPRFIVNPMLGVKSDIEAVSRLQSNTCGKRDIERSELSNKKLCSNDGLLSEPSFCEAIAFNVDTMFCIDPLDAVADE